MENFTGMVHSHLDIRFCNLENAKARELPEVVFNTFPRFSKMEKIVPSKRAFFNVYLLIARFLTILILKNFDHHLIANLP